MSSSASPPPPLTDIGLNLTDDMFQGRYRDKSVHTADHDSVMARARAAGVVQAVLTGDDLDRSRHAVEMARRFGLKCTVGVHPCQVNAFERHPAGADAYMDELSELIRGNIGGKHGDGPVVAVGELGLDYDRLQHADKATQLKHFPPQLQLAKRFDLPLFLHARTSDAHVDLVRILRENGVFRGVVHSFDGTLAEAQALLDLGLDLGVNGCSLKTQANLDIVRALPLDRMHLESDAPWCTIGTTSAAHALLTADPRSSELLPLYAPASVKKERWASDKAVKGRNEPCATGLVALCVAALKGVPVEDVAARTLANSNRLFNL